MITDEIIKAIECCGSTSHTEKCKTNCAFCNDDFDMNRCIPAMAKGVIDLIKSQEEEIEKLKKQIEFEQKQHLILKTACDYFANELSQLRKQQPYNPNIKQHKTKFTTTIK